MIRAVDRCIAADIDYVRMANMPGCADDDPVRLGLLEETSELSIFVRETPARTPEGIAAKARLMVRLFGHSTASDVPEDGEALGISLALDLLGDGRAVRS